MNTIAAFSTYSITQRLFRPEPVEPAEFVECAEPALCTDDWLIWLLLLASYHPARSPTGDGEIEIKPVRAPKERFTLKQWWVSFVCLATIALWCVAHSIQDVIGDMGVIAIIPIVSFFSTDHCGFCI